jgi:hypothetical protein
MHPMSFPSSVWGKPSKCCPQPGVCPPGPPGPPGPCGDLDWGVPAYKLGVNSAATVFAEGDVAGGGVFLTTTCVMTAFEGPLASSYGVLAAQSAIPGSPGLDAVLAYVVHDLGLAFLTVNPALFSRTGLTVPTPATFAAALPAPGTDVFAIAPAGPSNAPGFVAGKVAYSPDGTAVGYATTVAIDVVGGVPPPPGTAWLDPVTGAVVAIQRGDGSALSGVLANATAVSWANGANVLSQVDLPGPSTVPQFRSSFALAQSVNAPNGEAVVPVFAPLVTAQIGAGLGEPVTTAPLILPTVDVPAPLGASPVGAWVWDLTTSELAWPLTGEGPTAGTFAPTIGSTFGLNFAPSTGATTAAFNFLHLANPDSFDDISGTGIDVSTNWTNDSVGYYQLTPDENFYVSKSVSGGVQVGMSCSRMFISALGLVAFTTAEYSLTSPATILDPLTSLKQLAADPNLYDPDVYPSLYAAPFFSSDFALPAATSDYSINPGEPGGPLQVYVLDDNTANTITVQWQGFSQSGYPVQFQLFLQYGSGSADDTLNGQVTFIYGPNHAMRSCADAKPWVTATRMTASPTEYPLSSAAGPDTIQYRQPQVLREFQLPLANELIYFGAHSYFATLGLAVKPTTTFAAAYPMYVDLLGGLLTTPTGTLVTNELDYCLLQYDWVPERVRVAAVKNLTIGTSSLNSPDLIDTIVKVTPVNTTAAAPYSVPVNIIVDSQQTPISLNASALTAFLQNVSYLGAVDPDTFTTTSSSLTFQAASTSLYSAAAIQLPPSVNPATSYTPFIQPDLASVSFTVSFATADMSDETTVLVIQLASYRSRQLVTEFATDDDDPPVNTTCLAIYYDGADYVGQLTSGIAGGSFVPVTVTVTGPTASATVTLTYTDTNPYERPNALVIGVAPTSSFSVFYSGYTGITGPVTVTFSGVQSTLWSQVSILDTDRSYAVTTGPVVLLS